MQSAGSFRFLDWDSSHFGIRIGRVLPIVGDGSHLEEALAWANTDSLDCMYLLLDSNDLVTIRLASRLGWRMVSTRVTLGAELSALVKSPTLLRQADAGDLPYLKLLAMRSHTDSRFYSDGNFSASACDKLYASWIERSVLDPKFAGAVFVPEPEQSEPGGYITCAIKDGVGDIGLIAVDPKLRRKRLGTRLLAEAARWFSEQGAKRVSIVTQGCNMPALRMNERFGFSIESIQLWFHWWKKG